MPKLAIVIPMYNEERGVERCVRAVCKVLSEKLPESKLFVVNDGSKDKTLSILQKLSEEKLPMQIVSHSPNRGYGGAILAGVRAADAANYEFALFMDSDLTNDPDLIPLFDAKVREDRFDLIKASRYVPGGGMQGVPLKRQIVTIVGNRVASGLFGMGINDCTNGFRAVRLSFLRDVSFTERGFPSIMEEMYWMKRKGARATEIPYTLTSRKVEDGPTKFAYKPSVVLAYLKYAVKAATFPHRS
jgi:dolichol-phosphate mannosyltransferase